MTVIQLLDYAPLFAVAVLGIPATVYLVLGIRWTVRYGWPSIEIVYWPGQRLILHKNDITKQHVQASMRRGLAIKRQWRRTARLLELSVEDKTARFGDHVSELFRDQSHKNVATQLRKNNQTQVSKVIVPKLKLSYDEFSVTADSKAIGKINVHRWAESVDDLAQSWRAHRVKVTAPEPGYVRARVFLREPLWSFIDNPLLVEENSLFLPAAAPGSLFPDTPFLIQMDEDGQPILINMATGSHILIAGVTRSGKSITANTLLAALNLMRNVRLYVIDANLATVAPWWRTAHTVCSDSHPKRPTEILQEIRAEMEARESVFWALRTDKITDFSAHLPMIVLVIDELANYTRHPDRKARDAFLSELMAVTSQAHKFGIRIVLITQKPEADVIPTGIRINLSGRFCHRVDTVEDFLHTFPMGRDMDITAADPGMPAGVSITYLLGMKRPVRARTAYTQAAACWAISDALCAHGAQLRRLPGDPSQIKQRAELEEAAYLDSVFN